MANQNDDSKKGLGSDNMDPQTKQDIQSKGGRASGGQENDSSDSGENKNRSSQSSGDNNFGPMKEEGQNQESADITSNGGQSSGSGGNRSQEE